MNGTFTFLIEHDIPDAEEYYLGGNELAGEVHLFTNYEEKGVFTHWFKPNIIYAESFLLDVECNDICKCTVKKREEVECKIAVEVEFLEENLKENYGYHSD